MQEIMSKLKDVSVESLKVKPLISDESLALFRRELEYAKNISGLTHEVMARSYSTDPENHEVVCYAVWITNFDRTKIVLVHARFPHIDTYENSAQWHQSVFLKPTIVYQSGEKIVALFNKHMTNREAV